jgi:hypothetical protein
VIGDASQHWPRNRGGFRTETGLGIIWIRPTTALTNDGAHPARFRFAVGEGAAVAPRHEQQPAPANRRPADARVSSDCGCGWRLGETPPFDSPPQRPQRSSRVGTEASPWRSRRLRRAGRSRSDRRMSRRSETSTPPEGSGGTPRGLCSSATAGESRIGQLAYGFDLRRPLPLIERITGRCDALLHSGDGDCEESGSRRPLVLPVHEDPVDDVQAQHEDAERPPRVGAAD